YVEPAVESLFRNAEALDDQLAQILLGLILIDRPTLTVLRKLQHKKVRARHVEAAQLSSVEIRLDQAHLDRFGTCFNEVAPYPAPNGLPPQLPGSIGPPVAGDDLVVRGDLYGLILTVFLHGLGEFRNLPVLPHPVEARLDWMRP